MNRKPCEIEGREKLPEIVDEAVEKNPFNKPSVVEVELYPETDENGNICAESVDVDIEESSPFEPINA